MDINNKQIDNFLKKTINNIYRNNFYSFFKEIAFPILFPNKELTYSKGTEILCEVGQCVSSREKDYMRVIVNYPPGLMKSGIISGALAAWHIGRLPTEKIFEISNTLDLVTRNIGWAKDIIKNPFYQQIFPNIEIKKDTEDHFKTSQNGEINGFTTFGRVTGQRCDFLIPDDYMSANMMVSKAETTKALLAWDNSFYSRLDSVNGIICIIEQRLDISDLTGFLSRSCPDEYKIISLPVYFEEKKHYYFNKKEFVFEENELLSPTRYSWEKIKKLQNRMVDDETGIANGKQVFFAQYMQNPVRAGGDMVDMSWFVPYKIREFSNMKFEIVVTSVDSAQKPNEINDPSAFLKFGIIKDTKFLGDHYCEKKVYPETKENLINFCNKAPRTTYLIIEDANTGSSLIQELPLDERMQGIRIIAVSHGGIKKEIRFLTATGAMSAGKTHFPKDAPWYSSFENELMQFPKIRHDDRADAYAQFEKWFTDYNRKFEFWCTTI